MFSGNWSPYRRKSCSGSQLLQLWNKCLLLHRLIHLIVSTPSFTSKYKRVIYRTVEPRMDTKGHLLYNGKNFFICSKTGIRLRNATNRPLIFTCTNYNKIPFGVCWTSRLNNLRAFQWFFMIPYTPLNTIPFFKLTFPLWKSIISQFQAL